MTHSTHKVAIRIIKASSIDREGRLPDRIEELRQQGFQVIFDDLMPDPSWPFCAASIKDRLRCFEQALLEEKSDIVMWARGGYGASELIEQIPWSSVKTAKPKPIVGFSDATAAQSALWVMTGRWSIHGPMPATTTWNQNSDRDTKALIKLLKGSSECDPIVLDRAPSRTIEGRVFGGCLSVLTNLIGTPYLPRTMSGSILVFEDIGERPGPVMRMLHQWKQAGLFAGVKALIFGNLTQLGGSLKDNDPIIMNEIRARFDLPIFETKDIGHVSPNMPYIFGGDGIICNNTFHTHKPKSDLVS